MARKEFGKGAITINTPQPPAHINKVKVARGKAVFVVRMKTTNNQVAEREVEAKDVRCQYGSICAIGKVAAPEGTTAVRVFGKVYPTSQIGDESPPLEGAGAATEGDLQGGTDWGFTGHKLIPNAACEPPTAHAVNFLRIWVQLESKHACAYIHETIEFWGQVSTQTECDKRG